MKKKTRKDAKDKNYKTNHFESKKESESTQSQNIVKFCCLIYDNFF